MRDYRIKAVQKAVTKPHQNPIDIVIVTYNRLVYLERCIFSILLNTSVKHRIFVIDDCSNDGTQKWLLEARNRKWIYACNLNKKGQGTAKNFNDIIDATEGEWIVMLNDDFYFHRYWDFAGLDIINSFDDCGIVSFYNYTRYSDDQGVEHINDNVMRVVRSGLGSAFLNRELYEKAGKFIMPVKTKLMGFFTTPFCQRSQRVDIQRNKHYVTIPYYSTNMDLPKDHAGSKSIICERDNLKKYDDHRFREKMQGKDRLRDNINQK